MVTRNEWYERVNSQWPAEVPLPSSEEAKKAARKLYRFVIGRKLELPINLVSGNRYSYARSGKLNINPNSKHHGGGWKAMVHDLSHWLHRKISNDKPHAASHARLELRLIKEVVKRGWLTGSLLSAEEPAKPEPSAKTVQALRYQRILKRRGAWEAKQKRAQRALRKLARQASYYERTLSQTA